MTGGRVVAATYVATVTGAAAVGFAADSPAAILLAGALALPSSLPAGIAFYLAYGLLALVPGANPDEGSGSETCAPGGTCVSTSSGDLAPWFVATTDVLGIVALAAAAIANVLLWRLTRRRNRARA